MRNKEIEDVLAWLKSTDLVEVSYKKGGEGFSMSLAQSPHVLVPSIPEGRFAAVGSPVVGVYRSGALGRPASVQEGTVVKEGETLGLVESAPGKTVAVKSSCGGRISRVMVEAGVAVEYGQPLFFIEKI